MFEVIKIKIFVSCFLDFYFSTLSVKRLRLLTKSRYYGEIFRRRKRSGAYYARMVRAHLSPPIKYGRVAQSVERRKIIDS